MIEGAPLPLRCGVTRVTGGRESRRRVIRIGGLLELGQVATGTLLRRGGEIGSNVALRARHRAMRASQRERGLVMGEDYLLPLDRRMAQLAGGRLPRSRVVWICRLVEILHVTATTARRYSPVLAAHMAGSASHRAMRAREFERA